MALEITDANYAEIIAQDKPVMIDFWAVWCGPCRALAPIVEDMSKEYEGRAIIGKLDVDNNPLVSQQLGIRNIPTILFFKGGQMVDKQVGAVPKSVLVKKIDAQLN